MRYSRVIPRDLFLAVENSISRHPPDSAILAGVYTVEGEVRVDFTSPALAEWFKREQARVANVLLRMARPHMTRRGWRRFRAKWKASHRGQ